MALNVAFYNHKLSLNVTDNELKIIGVTCLVGMLIFEEDKASSRSGGKHLC